MKKLKNERKKLSNGSRAGKTIDDVCVVVVIVSPFLP
jgi:hypothetical protein